MNSHTTGFTLVELMKTTVAATPNPSFRRVDAQVSDGPTPLLRVSGLVGRY